MMLDVNTDRRVLLVEDEPGLRYALHRLLTVKGWECRCAASLAEAMVELSPLPQRVLLDLRLPDGSGMDLLKYIREKQLPVRVAVMTVYHEMLPEVSQFHPDRTFLKPNFMNDLAAWLSEAS